MTDPKKRLAIFVPSMCGDGAERAMLNLAQGVAERGYAVDLVLARAEGSLLAEVPESVRVVDLKASRVLASLPALVRYLRRERPQAMLSVMGHANIIALWGRRLAGVPTRVVVSERNTLLQAAEHASRLRGRLMPQLIRRSLLLGTVIMRSSQQWKKPILLTDVLQSFARRVCTHLPAT